MSNRLKAIIKVDDIQTTVPLCLVKESYNAGWRCDAFLFGPVEDDPFRDFMNDVTENRRIQPGKTATLLLGLLDSNEKTTVLRHWPCVIDNVKVEVDAIVKQDHECHIYLVDPVTYMAKNTVWGVYRFTSLAEVIGGVLALAGGGSGTPTLTPLIPDMPSITITSNYRESLNEIPYVIAAGETLEEWLDKVASHLGIRYEMLGNNDGSVQLMLSDKAPMVDNVIDMEGSNVASETELVVYNYSSRTYASSRGFVLDDAFLGSIYNAGSPGGVGRVIFEQGIGFDESQARVYYPTYGAALESFLMYGESQQAEFRPGKIVSLSYGNSGEPNKWQLTNVMHTVKGNTYKNISNLSRADNAWHPSAPIFSSPVLVGASVDSGPDYDTNDSVPRDRLGQIDIRFPFVPTSDSSGTESVGFVDADRDGILTLDDFDPFTLNDFSENSAEWESDLEKYDNGQYNDPYEGQSNSQLTAEQLETRNLYIKKRQELEKYKSYKVAKEKDSLDVDGDGLITSRDKIASNQLSTLLHDDDSKEEVKNQWEKFKNSLAMEEFGSAFNAGGVTYYSVDTADAFDAEVVKLRNGEYDDPDSDNDDEKVSPLELAQLNETREKIKRYILYREWAIRKFIEAYDVETRDDILEIVISEAQETRESEIEGDSTISKTDIAGVGIYKNELRGTPGYVNRSEIYPYRFKLPASVVNFLVSDDSIPESHGAAMKDGLKTLESNQSAEILLSVAKIGTEYSFHLGADIKLVLYLYAKIGISRVYHKMYNYAGSSVDLGGGEILGEVVTSTDITSSGDQVEIINFVPTSTAGVAGQGLTTIAGVSDYDMVIEYGLLFDDDYENYFSVTEKHRKNMEKYARESQKWPPRIPLRIVSPIAGGLHGFIPSHRQGDSCRVAVYNPFSAEIIGFQYRDNAKIGTDNVNAITGLVVDHNGASEWTGIVFRNITEDEIEFNNDVDAEFDPDNKLTWMAMFPDEWWLNRLKDQGF